MDKQRHTEIVYRQRNREESGKKEKHRGKWKDRETERKVDRQRNREESG